MSLEELIDYLASKDPDTRVPIGFSEPCSYRGSYDELAFITTYQTTVSQMLESARSALNATFTGYKGGEYVMHPHTPCHLVPSYSSCGETIGPVLLAYMVNYHSQTIPSWLAPDAP